MKERLSNEEALKRAEEKIADRDLDMEETRRNLQGMLEDHGVVDSDVLEIFDEAGDARYNKEPDNHYKGAI